MWNNFFLRFVIWNKSHVVLYFFRTFCDLTRICFLCAIFFSTHKHRKQSLRNWLNITNKNLSVNSLYNCSVAPTVCNISATRTCSLFKSSGIDFVLTHLTNSSNNWQFLPITELQNWNKFSQLMFTLLLTYKMSHILQVETKNSKICSDIFVRPRVTFCFRHLSIRDRGNWDRDTVFSFTDMLL